MGEWVFRLAVKTPTSHMEYLVGFPAVAPNSSFLLMPMLEGSSDSLSDWVLVIHMGDLDCVSSF